MNIDKLNTQEQLEMLRQIDREYSKVKLPDIEPIYNDQGEITNEKEIKDILKKILVIVSALWLANKTIIDTYGGKVIGNTYTYYNALKVLKKAQITSATFDTYLKRSITTGEWNSIINKAMEKRARQVNINQVIKGNVKTLNKRLQRTVVDMYKSGKSKPQIAKELQRQLGYNKKKAKVVATTEVNYYKSEAQLGATDGLNVKKIWVWNPIAKEPREAHIQADGQVVIGRNNYFNIGGKNTLAPQHFGDPEDDISCHCTMRIEVIE